MTFFKFPLEPRVKEELMFYTVKSVHKCVTEVVSGVGLLEKN